MTDRQEPLDRDRLGELFEQALEQPPERRHAFLAESCGSDKTLYNQLTSLLASHAKQPNFLDNLAEELFPVAPFGPLDPVLSPGQIAGHYQILEFLGGGGMGRVYKARDLHLGRLVALKFLPAHLTSYPRARARLKSEARAASALDHPNVAVLYEIGMIEGLPRDSSEERLFIAMGYYDGETLEQIIARDQLSMSEALDLTRQIADGLAAAHRRGIVHRDIKPANVIVTPEGVAKIVDFGIAKGTGAQLTREGARLGTVAYMSPEQTRGDAVDHRTDLWSLGVVAYEMLTGARPFQGSAEAALIYSIRHDDPPPVEALRSDIPEAFARVVMRCLAKDPAARHPKAEDVLTDLRAAAGTGHLDSIEQVWQREGIVVLPFVNISPDPDNAYFSDGLTEEVIADLSHLRALRVISRTSSMRLKGSDKDVRTIARELGVRYVLEGSVRKAGDTLRISAQLIDAQEDATLWARKLMGMVDDIFAIQEEVARTVADALRIRLSTSEVRALAERPIPDVQAYESYLRARYEAWHFTQEGLERAKRYIETALSIVGDNELLYSTLGHIIAMHLEVGIDPGAAGLGQVGALTDKIFALNPDSARGYWLEAIGAFFSGDLRRALRAGERALALDPYDSDTLILLGYVYGHAGRNADALALLERAMAVDPLMPLAQAIPGFIAVLEGRFGDAVEPYRRFQEMDPDSPFGMVFYGWALAYDRRIEEATSVLQATADRFPGTVFASLARALAHALEGDRDATLRAITPAFKAAARNSEMFARELAHCYALVDETEEALDWLEREIELGMLNYSFLATHDWFLDDLRDEPRFQQLIAYVHTASAKLDKHSNQQL